MTFVEGFEAGIGQALGVLVVLVPVLLVAVAFAVWDARQMRRPDIQEAHREELARRGMGGAE